MSRNLIAAALAAAAAAVTGLPAMAQDAAQPSDPANAPAATADAPAAAPQSDVELARKLANPVSSMISVPLQNNFDCCYGPQNGVRYSLNIQPVIPFSLGPRWNLITRTIVPLIDASETAPGAGSHAGLGDITQSFFFSPTFIHGVVIGAGPVMLWPTGTDHLGGNQWAAGPTVVVVKQNGPVTFGALVNHLWSYVGPAGRDEVSATLLQPFLNYTYPNTTSLSLNTETSYDWTHQQWTVPINAGIAHLFKIADQRVQFGLTGRVYAKSPPGGPDWGLRFTATLLFPQK